MLPHHNNSTYSSPGQIKHIRSFTKWHWERWHPMAVSHLQSLSSSVQPIQVLLPKFVYGDCITVCLVLCPCFQWIWLKNLSSAMRRYISSLERSEYTLRSIFRSEMWLYECCIRECIKKKIFKSYVTKYLLQCVEGEYLVRYPITWC